jgi:glycosyltransferase involved in cell wall biosynthesis
LDSQPQLTTVIVRHSETLFMMSRCVQHLLSQGTEDIEIIVVDQKDDGSLEKLPDNLNVVYLKTDSQSLSVSRNIGIKHASSRYVAFTEPDCIVKQGWGKALSEAFNTGASIVGGRILLKMNGKERFYHKSIAVRELFGQHDKSEEIVETDRVLGGNMAINKELLGNEAYFDERYGRNNEVLVGGEDTTFCKRVREKGYIVCYHPNASVEHLIQPERMKLRFLVKRIFFHGFSRAGTGGVPRKINRKFNRYDYVVLPFFVPLYFSGYFYGKARRVF